MTEEEITDWREHPVTVSLLGMMEVHADDREYELKNQWFNGADVDRRDVAYLDGYRTTMETLASLDLMHFEALRGAIDARY